MPIPCQACSKPVHEQSVRCPHCGNATGVELDPVAAAEADMILERKRELDDRDVGFDLLLRDHRLPKPVAPAEEPETDDDFPTARVVKRD
ncbi:MAG: hypothetical protein QM831_17210 [Kofleriaceae bacterium]